MSAPVEISAAELLEHAKVLTQDLLRQGYSLTLRQLYYQLVARAIIPNGQEHYKRLGDTISRARLRGDFPLHWIVDRGRIIHPGEYTHCDDDIQGGLERAARAVRQAPEMLLRRGRWWGQKIHVSVWVEKMALSGVFERPCDELGVSWFACEGYPSHGALFEWLQHTTRAMGITDPNGMTSERGDFHKGVAEKCVVLYFGDHDPDGWQIPRSAEDVLRNFAQQGGANLDLRFKRVALNMAQIAQYQPPPFPAKPSSSRYAGYIEEHGTEDAWELDALAPSILDALIRTEVAALFDQARYQELQADLTRRRARMSQVMRTSGWLQAALRSPTDED